MSLIHYWPLDEASGAAAGNLVGPPDALVEVTASGNIESTIATGKFGSARALLEAMIRLWTEGDGRALSAWSLSSWFRRGAGAMPAGRPDMYLWLFETASSYCLAYLPSGGSKIIFVFTIDSEWTEVEIEYEASLFNSVWHHVAVTCDGTTTKLYVDGTERASSENSHDLSIEDNGKYYGGFHDGAGVRNWNDATNDDLAIFDHALTAAEVSDIWAGGIGKSIGVLFPCPDPQEPFDDWAAGIDPITSQIYYALELDDGVLDPIRIPISSWQATLQIGRASYTQAVIPAALPWVSAVNARADGELIIYRGVRYSSGDTQEVEMARSPIQGANFDIGPTNATMRVSGYAQVSQQCPILTRTLQNVRSESTGSGYRVRADIDWFLRPGHTAISRGTSFTVSYINYYVTGGDEYMDVGERTL